MSRLLAHLESHPHQIHSVIASSPDEMQDDWYGAMTCLTAEILDGRGDFARQLGSDLYRLLGDVWLDDVKRVKAYLIWESNGANWDPTGWTRNFILACEDVNRRTLEESVKASPKTFAHVKTYLEKRYLVAGVVDLSHRPDAHHLIANKAQRIWDAAASPTTP